MALNRRRVSQANSLLPTQPNDAATQFGRSWMA